MNNKFILFYVILVLFTFNTKLIFVSTDDSVKAGADIDNTGADDQNLDGGQQQSSAIDDKDSDQSILYSTPNIDNYYIYEHFDDDQDFNSRWIRSESSKSDSKDFKYDGEWSLTQTIQSIKGNCALELAIDSHLPVTNQ